MRTIPLLRVAVVLCGLNFLAFSLRAPPMRPLRPPLRPSPPPSNPRRLRCVRRRQHGRPTVPVRRVSMSRVRSPAIRRLRAVPGANPPVDAEGDWIVGPDYVPAPETAVVAGVPQGPGRADHVGFGGQQILPRHSGRDVFRHGGSGQPAHVDRANSSGTLQAHHHGLHPEPVCSRQAGPVHRHARRTRAWQVRPAAGEHAQQPRSRRNACRR